MKCKCAKLPDAFYLDEVPRGFAKGLKREDDGNWIWLVYCPKCGALWAIDKWDKYQEQIVTRVRSQDGWDGVDTTDLRKQLLLKSRGGFTDAECIWAGCHDKAVKGVVYCLDHLWKTGARR
jgi:hypothetical protein